MYFPPFQAPTFFVGCPLYSFLHSPAPMAVLFHYSPSHSKHVSSLLSSPIHLSFWKPLSIPLFTRFAWNSFFNHWKRCLSIVSRTDRHLAIREVQLSDGKFKKTAKFDKNLVTMLNILSITCKATWKLKIHIHLPLACK